MTLADYPRPSVTADIVIFTLRERRLHVLLIQRGEAPEPGKWAIPGGFLRENESPEEAARRELTEETGVEAALLEQFRAYGAPGRDPRGWVITIAYTALLPSDALILRADTDAADARWFGIEALPFPLAFDHAQILADALASLRARLESTNVARGLLPARFTLTQLQDVYEALLGAPLDKRNFRKWILTLGLAVPTDQQARGSHRPALLYEFAPEHEASQPRFLWSRRAAQ